MIKFQTLLRITDLYFFIKKTPKQYYTSDCLGVLNYIFSLLVNL